MKINLLEYFEDSVRLHPQKKAVVDGGRDITFSNLKARGVSLAKAIVATDKTPRHPIGVFLDKSIESVVADIGILYSANFYMNLDVKTPAERIKNILAQIRPSMIVTNNKHIAQAASFVPEGMPIINVDEMEDAAVSDDTLKQRRDKLIDTDPSCIINTSGSTGTPKGVVLNHRSFFDFTEWAIDTFSFDESMVMGSLSPIVFDIYSFELCMLMAKAATLVVLPGNMAAFPAKILEILEKEHVNFLFWVPTIMVNIANMDLLASFPLKDLRTVWFAGEVFPTKQFNYWHRHLPQTTFANLYGPIEITLDCTYYILDHDIPDNEPLPIGRPCRNTDVLVLDDDDHLVEGEGVEGELCVRGSSLAMGYYNNPDKTAAAFTQNPLNHSYPEIIYRTGDIVSYAANGDIMFHGRKDNIIKHQGYRTDLGEIEHVIINTLKIVKNGCVVYNQARKEITLFYEADADITPREFRKQITRELPNYMVPTVYHREEILRRNTNGKIDRLYYKKLVNDGSYK